MNHPLPTIQPVVPVVCRLLRTKTAFGSFADTGAAPWQAGESTTAVFWCLATMQTAGPDHGLGDSPRGFEQAQYWIVKGRVYIYLTKRPNDKGFLNLAISHQPSAVSYQLSVVGVGDAGGGGWGEGACWAGVAVLTAGERYQV